MDNKNVIPVFLLGVLMLLSCQSNPERESAPKDNQAKEEIQTEDKDWIALFDGTTTKGWRGFNQTTMPESWIVEDGTLKSLGKGGDIGGDIVYSDVEFEDFELVLEWKIVEGGNSGIFYHVQEGEQYEAPYENAPEYQLIDDIGFPEKLEDWQQTGADYAMYPANPGEKTLQKVGEWNSSRIVFQKEKVEYWLNGKKVVEFVPWSEDWNQRKSTGKWKDYPDYGKAKKGLIGLQDHGSFIWFKHIKARKL